MCSQGALRQHGKLVGEDCPSFHHLAAWSWKERWATGVKMVVLSVSQPGFLFSRFYYILLYSTIFYYILLYSTIRTYTLLFPTFPASNFWCPTVYALQLLGASSESARMCRRPTAWGSNGLRHMEPKWSLLTSLFSTWCAYQTHAATNRLFLEGFGHLNISK